MFIARQGDGIKVDIGSPEGAFAQAADEKSSVESISGKAMIVSGMGQPGFYTILIACTAYAAICCKD